MLREMLLKAAAKLEKKDEYSELNGSLEKLEESALALKVSLDVERQRADDFQAMYDEAKALANAAEQRALMLERKVREYVDIVYRVEKQSNDWRDRWWNHSTEHQRAQALLEDGIYKMRAVVNRALEELNKYRAADGKPQLTPMALMTDPIGLSLQFQKSLEEMRAQAPKDIDVSMECEKIEGLLIP